MTGWSLTPSRRDDPGLMDAPGSPRPRSPRPTGCSAGSTAGLGNLRSLRRELNRHLDEDRPGPGPVTVLDVGSDSGDLPQAIRDSLEKLRIRSTVVALDRNPTAVRLAGRHATAVVRGDASGSPSETARSTW